MILSLIAAVSENMAIGNQGDLIYHLPDDLKRFKKLTSGHTVIMGRKTFDSLPGGALPNRRNIVISRTLKDGDIPGVEIAGNITEAILKANACEPSEEVFVIGGASIYKEMMERGLADRIYLTEVKDTPENADTFFPEIPDNYDVSWAECHTKDERHAFDFDFVNYEKIKK